MEQGGCRLTVQQQGRVNRVGEFPAGEDRLVPGTGWVTSALNFVETKRIHSQGVLNLSKRLVPLLK